MKHTEGPWQIEDLEKGDAIYVTVPGKTICILYRYFACPTAPNETENKANAHLIVTAPQMLECLTELTDLIDGLCKAGYPTGRSSYFKAISVIKKAKGEFNE